MERTQFTFYDSFYRALSRIRSKTARCDAYDAICRYALLEEEPDLDSLPNTTAIVFEMVRPILYSGRKKAESGCRGASKRWIHEECDPFVGLSENMDREYKRKNGKIENGDGKTENADGKSENSHSKNKDKNKNKLKNKDKCPEAFASFWEAYPRKEGKQKAYEAFEKVDVPLEVLLEAIAQQRQSDQWNREGGRFIPHGATWLSEGRWEDQLPMRTDIPKGASGNLGQAELEAIRQVLAMEDPPDDP